MADHSKIEWTEATWNPLRARHPETGKVGWSCVRVSPGCTHCYAATQNRAARFFGTGLDYTVPDNARAEHFLDERTLSQPLRWQKPRMIFVCSMTDLFGDWVHQGENIRVRLRDRKGGDPSEWPADLRGCRAFPTRAPVSA